jgi:hypothetical protein
MTGLVKGERLQGRVDYRTGLVEGQNYTGDRGDHRRISFSDYDRLVTVQGLLKDNSGYSTGLV